MLGERAHIDYETASPQPLGKGPNSVGVYRYAEDPRTRVWGFRWRIGNMGIIHEWRPGYPEPVALLMHIASGGLVVAHNAAFERTIWRMMKSLYKLHHWPDILIEQQSCTMARALAMHLPADLETLMHVLESPVQKDMEGAALMKRMAKPKRIHPDGSCEWHDEPANIGRIMLYCGTDVESETVADELVPELSPREQMIWQLDQRINDRGVRLDVDAIVRAVDVVEIAKREADKEMRQVTNGAVEKCSQIERLVNWINTNGFPCESAKKGDHDDIILAAGGLPDTDMGRRIVRAIELRKAAAKTSTAKYVKMLNCLCGDDRTRGLLAYHGAGPGRWAGRLWQPQNLPRVDADTEAHIPEIVCNYLKAPISLQEAHDMIALSLGSPLVALSKTLRAMIIAEPGNILYGGDYANIEGRINAWLAGEAWKLQAFRDYDTFILDAQGKRVRKGPDLYKITAGSVLGKEIADVASAERQAYGKVPELALGYQGGVGAFIDMGDTYNVKPEQMVGPVRSAISAEQWDNVAIKYEKATDKFGLPEDQWVAIKATVQNWRKANSHIMEGWWELSDAVVEAVEYPHTAVNVYGGRASFLSTGDWLYIKLPSTRIIAYARPTIHVQVQTFVDKNGEEYERKVKSVRYLGKNPKTGVWGERYLYGGLLCENIVQATARCVMDHGMERVENAGYHLILTVHDELLCETNKAFGSVDEFLSLMTQPEDWYEGLPLAASAWSEERYIK